MWRRLSDCLRVLSPRRSNRRSSELTESDWRGGKAPSVKAGSTASDNGSASPAGRSGDEPPSRPAAPPLSDFLKPPRARKPRTAFVLRSAVLLNVRVDARDDELREAYWSRRCTSTPTATLRPSGGRRSVASARFALRTTRCARPRSPAAPSSPAARGSSRRAPRVPTARRCRRPLARLRARRPRW